MLAIRHLPWPFALLLALAALLIAAGLLPGTRPGPEGLTDQPTMPAARTWSEVGSNRPEVWEKLEREADLLVLGQEMTPAERGRCVKALALALAQHDLEIARPFTDPLLAELRLELIRHLGESAGDALARLDEKVIVQGLFESRTGRPAGLTVAHFRAEVGFATYRNWRLTVTESQAGRREQREPLADTYQPYMRLLMVLE